MFLSRGDRDLGVAFQTHPGSAVSVDGNGVETFDSRFVAAAALSLVAALARKVLDIKLSEDYADDTGSNISEELPTADTAAAGSV